MEGGLFSSTGLVIRRFFRLAVQGMREGNLRNSGVFRQFRRDVAERVGFEPTVPFWSTHDFQSCTFDQLGHLSVIERALVA